VYWNDMREFLAHLDKKGDLVTVAKPVSTKWEIAAYIRKSSDTNGPCFVFDEVAGHPGWRASGAMYATPGRVLDALGVPIDQVTQHYLRAIQNPIPWEVVDGGPCKEVVVTGEDVDLATVPVVTHSEKDGPFITAGVQVARDPDTGVHGLGMHRMEVFGRDRLGLWAPNERRIGRARLKREERGERLEVAVVIGPDPCTVLGACARVPHDQEKYAIGGALLGAPLKLTWCETIDVLVPASAECVIEGYIEPGDTQLEAPFGEFPGCYGGRMDVPVMTVTAITHRRDPIFQTVLTGFPVTEDHLLNWVPMNAVVYEDAKRVSAGVIDVTVKGNYVYEAVVKMRKRHQSEPWNVMSAVLAGNAQAKYCVVVDEDVNIFDDREVNWAISTRSQPATDVHIFPVMVGAPLDPSAPLVRQTSKMGTDATKPLGAEALRYEKVLVPGADEVTW
jgi:2,5-furandicarboxylate decarboxylase 1